LLHWSECDMVDISLQAIFSLAFGSWICGACLWNISLYHTPTRVICYVGTKLRKMSGVKSQSLLFVSSVANGNSHKNKFEGC